LMQLSSFEEKGVGLFNIVFVGQNEFNDILLEECNRAPRQRTAVNYHLTPLTQTETEQYIDHRLKVANGQKEIFTSEAIHEVFLQSGGIPRLINIVCDLALLMTYLEGGSNVRAEAVKQGVERLRLPGERPTFTVAGTERPPALEDKVSAGEDDQILRKVVKEDAARWVKSEFLWARDKFLRARGKVPLERSSLLWAGGVALGIVLLVLVLLFYLGKQDRTSEASIEKVSQEASITPAETNPSKELGVSGAATSSSSRPTLLQEADKVPESSARRQASSGLVKAKPSKKASVQAAREESGKDADSSSSVVPPRKTITELLREENPSGEIENGTAEKREPPLGDGQGRSGQSPGPTAGPSVRETPGQETQEVEPGIVIDWLLEKREKK